MSSKFAVNRPHAISETIDGETVIVNLHTGWYYTLSGVGVPIWKALETVVDPSEVSQRIADVYDLPPARVTADLDRLVEVLCQEQLVIETDEEAAALNGGFEASDLPETYEVPVLEKFTDMEDLILLDPVHEVDERGWPHARESRSPES